MWRLVVCWDVTDVSEEHIASIFRVEEFFFTLVLAEKFFFDPEDGGDMFLRNVGCISTDYTASHPRRWHSLLIYLFIYLFIIIIMVITEWVGVAAMACTRIPGYLVRISAGIQVFSWLFWVLPGKFEDTAWIRLQTFTSESFPLHLSS
jgi:hypothetical protein